tara:strand:- start:2692 stop:2904 length:213 start_codon:yes stop_codon:yes gene_type:complete
MEKVFDVYQGKKWVELKQKEKGDRSLFDKAVEAGKAIRIRGLANNGKEFFKVIKNADVLPEGEPLSQRAV